MPIKAIILDLDGTLITSEELTVDGTEDFILYLNRKKLRWAITSNRGFHRAKRILQKNHLQPDLVVTNDVIKIRKPSPKFCQFVADKLALNTNELIYVGDDDRTDAFCAANAKVLYFNANWSNPNFSYGLPLESFTNLKFYLDTFLSRKGVWYWKVDSEDQKGNPIVVRSLYRASNTSANSFLKTVRDAIKGIRPIENLQAVLFIFFLTSIYLDGLYAEIDWWTIYPSSGQTTPRKWLKVYMQVSARLFKDRYISDLLIRHCPAVKSAYARYRGEDPGFTNQSNTVMLNPAYKGRLDGKNILVVDDFTTRSYSFECARNLLLLGGAESVTCVSFGNYYNNYQITVPKTGTIWNCWEPNKFSNKDFISTTCQGSVHQNVLEDFFNRLKSFA